MFFCKIKKKGKRENSKGDCVFPCRDMRLSTSYFSDDTGCCLNESLINPLCGLCNGSLLLKLKYQEVSDGFDIISNQSFTSFLK